MAAYSSVCKYLLLTRDGDVDVGCCFDGDVDAGCCLGGDASTEDEGRAVCGVSLLVIMKSSPRSCSSNADKSCKKQ